MTLLSEKTLFANMLESGSPRIPQPSTAFQQHALQPNLTSTTLNVQTTNSLTQTTDSTHTSLTHKGKACPTKAQLTSKEKNPTKESDQIVRPPFLD